MILFRLTKSYSLTKSSEAQKIYTIEEGDSCGSIRKIQSTVEDILKANPDLEEEGILQIVKRLVLTYQSRYYQ